MEQFNDFERAYHYWKASNPGGHVLVQIEQPPDGPSVVLHAVTCPLLGEMDALVRAEAPHVRSRRNCGRSADEIGTWAVRCIGMVLTRCGVCQIQPPDPYVRGDDLAYDAIVRRGGVTNGLEDFAVIACPVCSDVYLVDVRTRLMYVDATDLARRLPLTETAIECLECGGRMPVPDIVRALRGEPSHVTWRVGWKTFRASHWAWAAGRDAAADGT
jgi:hypothetical protein